VAQQQRRGSGRPGAGPRSRATPARATVTPAARATRSAAPAAPRPASDHVRSASRPASARRAAVTGAAKRTRAPQPRRFTGRAAVLLLVLGALLFAYAYPIRLYLNQQAQIADLEASQAAQRQRIRDLATESDKWNDPAYVAAQARSRLQMVKPGETVYLPYDPTKPAAAQTDPDAGHAKDTGPWYGQLWSSVQAADKPRNGS
jgi:cell division protein FtsB